MAGILGIEYVLPEKVLTNDELAESFKSWSADKILKKTGISSRHIAADGETACDLGTKAAEKLISAYGISREDIDFIIFISQSPDYLLPTTACIIQDRLNLKKQSGAFDLNLGCSGYIYGLAVAKGIVDSGMAKNVLLITSETYTKHINPFDRSTRTIFGDGAAATLVGQGGMTIGDFDLGTDGSGQDLLKIPAGGMRMPRSEETAVEYDDNGNIRSKNQLYMNGTGVFEFSIREVPESVDNILRKSKLSKSEIDVFIFHQANKFMLDFLQRHMKIDEEKFYQDFSDIGNTVCASIPIALKRAMGKNIIKNNQKILLCGFGVGLSWGSTIIYTGEENDSFTV